jgi:hypothetical protein
MRRHPHPRALVGVLISGLLLLLLSAAAVAAPVEFALDPSASTFRVGGTFNGVPLTGQSSASASTGYAGTLLVEVDPSTGRLSFTTPRLTAQDQPQGQLPIDPNWPGANYGLVTATGPIVNAAIRSMDLYLRADDAPYNGAAPTGSELGMFVSDGSFYFSPPATPLGYADMHGKGGGAKEAGPITLVSEGGFEVLTIPLRTSFTLEPHTPDAVVLMLEGQVVATRAVPEPAGLLGIMFAAFLANYRRRS